MTKQSHPVAEIFPLMTDAEFESLKASIAKSGLREAIWLHPDGRIVDGRNRYRACMELGIEPKFRTWDGEGSLVSFVLEYNLERRNLTSSQLAFVALDILPALEEEAKERQRINALTNQPQNAEKIPHSEMGEKGEARQQAAAVVGTNEHYVSDAKSIEVKAPELAAEVRAGDLSISQAKQFVKMPKEKRAAVKTKMQEMGTNSVTKASRQVMQDERKEAPPLPTDKYRVIYADPPWPYYNTMPEGTTQPNDYYALMSMEEIIALPVKDLAENNSVLFLWTTSPHLPEAFKVIEAWGYQYKSSFVWDKVKHNMGHYNSVRHEFLLVCVRGSCQPDVAKLFDSVQTIERTGHSVKPEEFRQIIDTIYPYGKRIELFARRAVDGWDRWGNEI